MDDLETALKNFVDAHAKIPPSTPNSNSTSRGQKRRADGTQLPQSQSSGGNPLPEIKRNLAKELYGGKADGELAEQFLACIHNLDESYERNPQLKGWKTKTGATIEEILISTFLTTVNERRRSLRKPRNAPIAGELSDEKSIALHSYTSPATPHIQNGTEEVACSIVTDAQTRRILSALMPIEFGGQDSKGLWRYILMTLLLPVGKQDTSDDLKRWFVEEVQRNAKSSYLALVHCLNTAELACHISTPNIVARTLLLGPLRGATVEKLANCGNRDGEFRELTRKLILELKGWRKGEKAYKKGCVKHGIDRAIATTYQIFKTHLSQLLCDLRHGVETTRNLPPVHIGYIKKCLSDAAKKIYVEKSLPAEHLDDLIHTALTQRPELCPYVLGTLLKERHGDEKRASKWARFDPSKSHSDRATKYLASDEIDLHQADTDEFLSIPDTVNVVHVDSVAQLKLLEGKLDECLADCTHAGAIPLGVDAEWSAYVSRSRASLLQMALGEAGEVYLLDLDALAKEKKLNTLMERIFSEQRLLKIGLQLQGDLRELREVITDCPALYQPEGVVCIAKTVARLVEMSSTTAEKEHLIDEFFPQLPSAGAPTVPESPSEPPKKREKLEDGLDVAQPAPEIQPTPPKTPNVNSLSLSTLCHRMLGKPLDKSEQRSVWTRRPLRQRQVRYAALDAHCLIQLYAKCKEWAEKLGVGIEDLCKEQEKIGHPLPLFWGRFNEIE